MLSFSKIKKGIPWWGKLSAKLFLARLPLPYNFWKNINLFEHGKMEDFSYAQKVFKRHFDKALSNAITKDFIVLELGPGDSLLSALIAYSYGASRCYLVDTGDFANSDITPYVKLLDFLRSQNLRTPNSEDCNTLKELLLICNAHYKTRGLISLRELQSDSIDFIWSHAVMEHIRKKDFRHTIQELRRIVRPNGICSFQIDLRDHLNGNLNNLRFSENFWESDFMANSGFYTNRIRYSKMLEIFQDNGFEVKVESVNTWNELPIPRTKMNSIFQKYSDSDLCIQDFSVLLKPIPINKTFSN